MIDLRRVTLPTPEQVWAQAVVFYTEMPPENLTVPEKVRLAHVFGWEHYRPLCPRCTPSPPVPNRPGSERRMREEAPCLTPLPA